MNTYRFPTKIYTDVCIIIKTLPDGIQWDMNENNEAVGIYATNNDMDEGYFKSLCIQINLQISNYLMQENLRILKNILSLLNKMK